MVSENIEYSPIQERSAPARYDLTSDELKQVEDSMVSYIEKRVREPGITALWIAPTNIFSNLVRTYEASYFPEVDEVSDEDESNTVFLALVDTREDSKRVVHGATVMYPKFMQSDKARVEWTSAHDGCETTTGFYTIDSLIERGNFTADEFAKHYKDKGIDLSKCLSVETNFRIGDRPENFNGLGSAEITYIALFEKAMAARPAVHGATIFATINNKQAQSFDRVGIRYEPIMDKANLRTEESELGIESMPIAIIYDQHCRDLMVAMSKEFTHLSVE